MKFVSSVVAVFTLLVVMLCVSCSTDDDNIPLPISLSYDNNQPTSSDNILSLLINNPGLKLLINGGDGKYKISNSDENVLKVKQGESTITLLPLSDGESTITISDSSDNSLALSVKVRSFQDMVIPTYRCLIYGDALTDDEVTALKTELLSLTNGYKFLYNANESSISKIRILWNRPDDDGGHDYECTSDINGAKIPESCLPLRLPTQINSYFVLKSEDEEFVLFISDYISSSEKVEGTRMSPVNYNCLVLDVTNRFKTKYPKLEKAYIVQGTTN